MKYIFVIKIIRGKKALDKYIKIVKIMENRL